MEQPDDWHNPWGKEPGINWGVIWAFVFVLGFWGLVTDLYLLWVR